MSISITGLQVAVPEDDSVKRTSEQIIVQVELRSAEERSTRLELEVCDLRGEVIFANCGPVDLPRGCSHASATIPPGTLGPGRYSLGARTAEAGLHRHRHMIEVLAGPGEATAAAAAAAAGQGGGTWEVTEGTMPRAPHLRRVEQVRFALEDGSEPLHFPSDRPVRITTRLDLEGLAADPLLRVQIFSQSGQLMVGTNTTRWEVALGAGGNRTVRVDFERLNLAPGHYFTTVGLWTDEVSGDPIEARHGYYDLLVDGPSR
jgi:hypothetical protein